MCAVPTASSRPRAGCCSTPGSDPSGSARSASVRRAWVRLKPAPPVLHELEAEIMEQVWALGEATVHAVRNALNAAAEKERAYTTVMTVMMRLDTKGLLKRERRGRRDHYVATPSPEQYLDARAQPQ